MPHKTSFNYKANQKRYSCYFHECLSIFVYVKAFARSNVLVFSTIFPMEFQILGSLCRSCWHGIFTHHVDSQWRKIRFNFRILLTAQTTKLFAFLQLCRSGGTVSKLVGTSNFKAIFVIKKYNAHFDTISFPIKKYLRETTFL